MFPNLVFTPPQVNEYKTNYDINFEFMLWSSLGRGLRA